MEHRNINPPTDYSQSQGEYSKNLAAGTLTAAVWISALISAVATCAVTLLIHGYDVTNIPALLTIRNTGNRLSQLEQRLSDLEATLALPKGEDTTLTELRAQQEQLRERLNTLRDDQVRIQRQTRLTESRLANVECDIIRFNLEAYGSRGYESGDYKVDPQACSQSQPAPRPAVSPPQQPDSPPSRNTTLLPLSPPPNL